MRRKCYQWHCLFSTQLNWIQFSIKIRCLLRKLITKGRIWAQPVSKCCQQESQECMEDLDSISFIQNTTWLIRKINETYLLHAFTVASICVIAAIVYVRTTHATSSSFTSRYVISKTIVAPIKKLNISKQELEAAALGAEPAGFPESEMTTTSSSKHFWTDFSATVRWIQPKQVQKMYNAKRFTKIQEKSDRDASL